MAQNQGLTGMIGPTSLKQPIVGIVTDPQTSRPSYIGDLDPKIQAFLAYQEQLKRFSQQTAGTRDLIVPPAIVPPVLQTPVTHRQPPTDDVHDASTLSMEISGDNNEGMGSKMINAIDRLIYGQNTKSKQKIEMLTKPIQSSTPNRPDTLNNPFAAKGGSQQAGIATWSDSSFPRLPAVSVVTMTGSMPSIYPQQK